MSPLDDGANYHPPSMASAKITDVKRDTFDSAQSGLNYLTSDQGVKISDTDNW